MTIITRASRGTFGQFSARLGSCCRPRGGALLFPYVALAAHGLHNHSRRRK